MRLLAVILCGLAALVAAPAASANIECRTLMAQCTFSDVKALGGTAPSRVHKPHDVAVAPDGRVAVADDGSRRGLVLGPDGRHVLSVGDGNAWVLNSVAFGPDGDLWTAEDGHIRRWGSDGAARALLTEGLLRANPGGGESYARMGGIAVDAAGRLYAIANDVLLIYGADGRLEREVERATAYGFSQDRVIGADGSGRVLVSDYEGYRVEARAADGTVTRVTAALPAGASVALSALDAQGRLYVPGTSEVWVYDRELAKVDAFAHGLAQLPGQMAVTADGLIFADSQGDRLVRVARGGAPLPAFGVDPAGGLNDPRSVVVLPDGRPVVADKRNHRVVRFEADGAFDRALRDFGPAGSEVPLSLALTAAGDPVVTYESGRVERLSPDGTVLAQWQVPGTPFLSGAAGAPDGTLWLRNRSELLHYSVDGALLGTLAAGLESTYATGNGLAIDGAGNLYAAEPRVIRKLRPDGTTIATYEAQLAEGVEVLADGHMVVAAQREVRLLAPDGAYLASWAEWGTRVGRIHLPFDVAVDAAGRFYVADHYGQMVVRFTFAAAPRPPAVTPRPAAPPAPVLRVIPPRRGTRATRSGTVRVRLACAPGGATCSGRLRLARRGSARASGVRAPRTFGERGFTLRPGRSAHVSVRLRASTRRALRAAGSLHAEASATLTGGARVVAPFVIRARR